MAGLHQMKIQVNIRTASKILSTRTASDRLLNTGRRT